MKQQITIKIFIFIFCFSINHRVKIKVYYFVFHLSFTYCKQHKLDQVNRLKIRHVDACAVFLHDC